MAKTKLNLFLLLFNDQFIAAGAPMPHKMEPYLDSNLFYRIRNECGYLIFHLR